VTRSSNRSIRQPIPSRPNLPGNLLLPSHVEVVPVGVPEPLRGVPVRIRARPDEVVEHADLTEVVACKVDLWKEGVSEIS